MNERSFRVSPVRLAILEELIEGFTYECGSSDWPMQEAEITIRKTIEQIREHYGDATVPGDALTQVTKDALERGIVQVKYLKELFTTSDLSSSDFLESIAKLRVKP